MDWRCGSSSRAPVLQEQSPEFKPQSHHTHSHKREFILALLPVPCAKIVAQFTRSRAKQHWGFFVLNY
jgi:hypothetical protein